MFDARTVVMLICIRIRPCKAKAMPRHIHKCHMISKNLKRVHIIQWQWFISGKLNESTRCHRYMSNGAWMIVPDIDQKMERFSANNWMTHRKKNKFRWKKHEQKKTMFSNLVFSTKIISYDFSGGRCMLWDQYAVVYWFNAHRERRKKERKKWHLTVILEFAWKEKTQWDAAALYWANGWEPKHIEFTLGCRSFIHSFTFITLQTWLDCTGYFSNDEILQGILIIDKQFSRFFRKTVR